jgi:ubiquinone/menaquinone biosynthesis C-methylase UbiE
MRHSADGLLENIRQFGTHKNALEIGCGDGSRSDEMASMFTNLTAIDPDFELIKKAIKNNTLSNRQFLVGSAENLVFPDSCFDLVIFTLSLHHIPIENMSLAIGEAIRVVKPSGHIIFIEPTFEGSFIQAEIMYGCCDGDERKEKAAAYFTLLNTPKLKEVKEFTSESTFEFDSDRDFFDNVAIIDGTEDDIIKYLKSHNYRLTAKRRINVFEKAI